MDQEVLGSTPDAGTFFQEITKMSAVKPKLLKGFKDLLPGEMLLREKIISQIKEVYESYGFVPLSTPAIEYKETLIGYGDEASKQIYMFREPDGYDVGLRFDLTVSLSRVMAMYRDIPRPFKRYQIQPVWRYDKPDPGRFREFLQFDIDTVGTKSMVADAEIITAMSDSLTRLGLKSTIRFSNRKVLNSLLAFAGIPEEMSHQLFRVLDKLDKQGLKNVILELGTGRTDDSGDKIAGLGLEDTQIARIEQFLSLNPQSRGEAIQVVSDLFEDVENAEEGIRELTEISDYLNALDIPDEDIVIDLGIARGLDYYTGPVFEAVLTDKRASRVGSVMGGGRYDDLIGRFTGEPVPATGASIGIDRLFAAVRLMEGSELRSSTADVLVTVMMSERITDYAKIAQTLRREGINTELYTGKQTSIGKQLKYADRQSIPVAVIIGSDEFDADQVSIKDLGKIKREDVDIKDRKEWVKEKVGQVTIPASDLVNTIKSILAGS